MLYYYRLPGESSPAGIIPLSGCFVEKLYSDSRFGMLIENNQREVRLFARNESDQTAWFSRICLAARFMSPTEKYKIGEYLGRGKFSNVFLAREVQTREPVALKVITKQPLRETQREHLRTELSVLRLISHSNIAEVRDVIETKNRVYVAMELLRGGDLFAHIRERRREKPLCCCH